MRIHQICSAIVALGCLAGAALVYDELGNQAASSHAAPIADEVETASTSSRLQKVQSYTRLLPVPNQAEREWATAMESSSPSEDAAIRQTEGLFSPWGRLFSRPDSSDRQQPRRREPTPQPQYQNGDQLVPTPDPLFSGGGRARARTTPGVRTPTQLHPAPSYSSPSIQAEPDPRFGRRGGTAGGSSVRAAPTPSTDFPVAVPRRETGAPSFGSTSRAEPETTRFVVPEAEPAPVPQRVSKRPSTGPAPHEIRAPELPRSNVAGPTLFAPSGAPPVGLQPVPNEPVLEETPTIANEEPVRPGRTPPPSQSFPIADPPRLQPEPAQDYSRYPTAERNGNINRRPSNNRNTSPEEPSSRSPFGRIGDNFRRMIPGFRR